MFCHDLIGGDKQIGKQKSGARRVKARAAEDAC